MKVGDVVKVLRIPGLNLLTGPHTAKINYVGEDSCSAVMLEDHKIGFTRNAYTAGQEWSFNWSDLETIEPTEVGTFPFLNPGKGRV